MKYIKICMRNKEHDITIPFEVAEKILESNQQLIMLRDENNTWTGKTINKTEIVATKRDYDEEKYRGYNEKQIESPKEKADFNWGQLKPTSK